MAGAHVSGVTLPETNSSPLKIGRAPSIFRGENVSLGEGIGS